MGGVGRNSFCLPLYGRNGAPVVLSALEIKGKLLNEYIYTKCARIMETVHGSVRALESFILI